MITLYYDLSSTSCKQALTWLKKHEIEYEMKRISKISDVDLMSVLSLTENGFSDILKRPSRVNAQSREELKKIEMMNFTDGIRFISYHTHLLKTPIIFENNKLTIGYNAENMRIFLSRDYRNVEML
jgi:regulatory protein spx